MKHICIACGKFPKVNLDPLVIYGEALNSRLILCDDCFFSLSPKKIKALKKKHKFLTILQTTNEKISNNLC